MSHELLEIPLRAMVAGKLHGSAWQVWAALKILDVDGEPTTVEAIQRLTGLPRSTVYLGRKVLSELADSCVQPTGNAIRETSPVSSPLAESESNELETGVELERKVVHTLVHIQEANGVPPPEWQMAVTAAAANVDITKSRDLWHEVFAPAYDLVNGDVAECIGLAAGYVELATGESLTTDDRKKVALLVRTYGKAGVYGIHQALGVTEGGTNMLKYARAVASRSVKEHRPR